MPLLQQLIDYLSRPPDSIVYHIVTLLALQAALGLAWWQARRRPDDDFARHLAWASGLILLSRLFILLALFATSGLVEANVLLPPLERAVDTFAVALLVWAFAPQPRNLPRLGTALLLVFTIVIALLFLAFANEWQLMVDSGNSSASYSATQQAVIWSILQMTLLALGSALVMLARDSQWSLRLAILMVLLVAQGLSLLFGVGYEPDNVDISFWARLGNVIAYPMLAILAYRHNLHRLLPTSHFGQPVVEQLVRSFELASAVSESLKMKQTISAALAMVLKLLPVHFAAIALVSQERPQYLIVSGRYPEQQNDSGNDSATIHTWRLRREEWPGLTQALREQRQVELVPDGPGAKQIHELSQKLGLGYVEALLIEPLTSGSTEIGLLLFSGGATPNSWLDEEKVLARALGPFVAHSLSNVQRYQQSLNGRVPDYESEMAVMAAELETVKQDRDAALSQVIELGDQLSETRNRLDTDHRRLRETTQALALVVNRQAKVNTLEEELGTLREALSEAELALAYAAAGQAGLSTEWVMRTVTRYSGELEEAQAQIDALEKQLRQQDGQELLEQAASQARLLRTPLTAIGGYTDLLLDRAAGEISEQQETLLRRMRVNVDNMTQAVDLITSIALSSSADSAEELWLSVREALEEALFGISAILQSKSLRVDLSVETELPPLQDRGGMINQLVIKALTAGCQVSCDAGRLRVNAVSITGSAAEGNTPNGNCALRLAIADDGQKKSHGLYAQAIGNQGNSGAGKMPNEAAGLSEMLQSISLLAASCGGRSWVDLSSETGSTLVVLLPLPDHGSDADESNQ